MGVYIPMLVFALVERRFIKNQNFWCAKLIGISVGLFLIPVSYYTYTGVFGVFADWLNIAIFFISAFASYFVETKLLKSEREFCILPLACLLVLVSIGIIFVAFTISPPNIPLFIER